MSLESNPIAESGIEQLKQETLVALNGLEAQISLRKMNINSLNQEELQLHKKIAEDAMNQLTEAIKRFSDNPSETTNQPE